MNIIAFDLGTHCGWASRGFKGVIRSGVEHLTTKRDQGGGMRYLRFKQFLEKNLLGNPGEDLIVVYEEVRRHQGVAAAHVYGGLKAILIYICEENNIPYESVPVQTIKKFATGKGNAGKPQMIDAVQMMGYEPKDDNEADAIALLLYKINDLERK